MIFAKILIIPVVGKPQNVSDLGNIINICHQLHGNNILKNFNVLEYLLAKYRKETNGTILTEMWLKAYWLRLQ